MNNQKLILTAESAYKGIYLLTFIALFILNNDRKSNNVIVLNSILSVFTLIFVFFLCIKPKINKIPIKRITFGIFLLIGVSVIVLIQRNYIIVHTIYLSCALYVAYSKYDIPLKMSNMCIKIALFSIIIQLLFFRCDDGRPVLSYIDPNYSGYCIFSLIGYSWYLNKRRIAVLLSLLGCITLSRNFIIAISIFYISIYLFDKNKILKRIFKVIPYYILFIGAFMCLIVLSFSFVFKYEGEKIVKQQEGSKDVTEFVDQSNMDRFNANIIFIAELCSNSNDYLLGKDIDEYTTKVFRNSPHNSVGQLILNYGLLYSIVYIAIYLSLLQYYKKVSAYFTPFFLALLVYFIFLGGGIFGIQVIWWSFVFKASIHQNQSDHKLVKSEFLNDNKD